MRKSLETFVASFASLWDWLALLFSTERDNMIELGIQDYISITIWKIYSGPYISDIYKTTKMLKAFFKISTIRPYAKFYSEEIKWHIALFDQCVRRREIASDYLTKTSSYNNNTETNTYRIFLHPLATFFPCLL